MEESPHPAIAHIDWPALTPCSGATFHLQHNQIIVYRGFPKCFEGSNHESTDKCMQNKRNLIRTGNSTRSSINAWIHIPDDGSGMWVQKTFVLHHYKALSNIVKSHCEGFVVYVTKRVGIRIIALLLDIWFDKCNMPNSFPSVPNIPLEDTMAWLTMFETYHVENDHRAKIVFCESVDSSTAKGLRKYQAVPSYVDKAIQQIQPEFDFSVMRVRYNMNQNAAYVDKDGSRSSPTTRIATISGEKCLIVGGLHQLFIDRFRLS